MAPTLHSLSSRCFIVSHSVLFRRIPFRKNVLGKNGQSALVIGTVGAWLAIYTGNLADPVVSREICDPTVLRTHEANAYMVGWSFSVASVLAAIEYFWVLTKLKKMLKLFVVAITIFGSGFLIYTGHLGATLVYQQGAGVYAPSEDCSEFSE
jgi:uncharacterized membrane protein